MGKQWKQCQTLFSGAPKSLQMVTAAMKLKDAMHKNLECQVHESRQIASGQTGDGKSEHQHSRNQRT